MKRDFICLFVLFCLSLLVLIFFKFSFVGCCRGEGKICGDWEVSGIKLHDLKLPKNQ